MTKLLNYNLRLLVICCAFFASQSIAKTEPIRFKLDGLNSSETETIKKGLSITHLNLKKNYSDLEIQNLHKLAIQEILEGVSSLGYYNAKLEHFLSYEKKQWVSHFIVARGPFVRVTSVKFEILGMGAINKQLMRLKKDFLKMQNLHFYHKNYEEGKNDLLNAALEQGYLNSVFVRNEILLNRETNEAKINLILDTGLRFQFGQVNFVGTAYPQVFLRRYAPFQFQEPYTNKKVAEFHKILTDTKLFSKVRIEPQMRLHQSHVIPINARVAERPKNRYSASLGYSTDLGIQLEAGYERRLITYPGHKLNVDLQASQPESKAQIKYSIPGHNPLLETTSLSTSYSQNNINLKSKDKNSEPPIKKINVVLLNTKKIGHFERGLSLKYLGEQDINFYNYERGFTDDYRGHKIIHCLLPGAFVSWSNAKIEDHTVLKGLSSKVAIAGGLKGLISTASLLKMELGFKAVYPLIPQYNVRFLVSSELGIIRAQDFDNVPISLRYRTGGDKSVRGYENLSLGPKITRVVGDKTYSTCIGGRYLWINNFEIDKAITPQLRVASFFDTGNAMNKWEALKASTGIGVRYSTPVGPLKLDLAFPIVNANNSKLNKFKLKFNSFRYHISFGLDL